MGYEAWEDAWERVGWNPKETRRNTKAWLGEFILKQNNNQGSRIDNKTTKHTKKENPTHILQFRCHFGHFLAFSFLLRSQVFKSATDSVRLTYLYLLLLASFRFLILFWKWQENIWIFLFETYVNWNPNTVEKFELNGNL